MASVWGVFAILGLLALLAPAPALASTMARCTQVVNELNQNLPMQVDQVTIWKGTVCLPAPKRVILRYIYELKIPAGRQVTLADLQSKLAPQQLAGWCTTPEQRVVIDLFDIEADYREAGGRHIGTLHYSATLCKRLKKPGASKPASA